MKAFLAFAALLSGGMLVVGNLAPKLDKALDTTADPEAFKLGLDAITGRLTERQLADLQATIDLPRAIPAPLHGSAPVGVAEVSIDPPKPVETPRIIVLEAWVDDRGWLWCRLENGSVMRRLESGEFVP